MTLYRHTGKKYNSVKPNKHGRLSIPDLDLEVGLLDGWVRYWYKGELLPLPGDLQRDLDEARRSADEASRRADDLQRRLDEEQLARRAAEAELGQLRTQMPPAKNRANSGMKPAKPADMV